MAISPFYTFDRDPFAALRRLQNEVDRAFTAPARVAGGFPAINMWQGPESAALTAELPGVAPGDIDITVKDQSPDPLLADLLRLARCQPDEIAILLHQRRRNAVLQTQAGLLQHVAALAVNRDQQLGLNPVVHLDQFGPARVPRYVDMRLSLGDRSHAKLGKLVHHPADRILVAGDLP